MVPLRGISCLCLLDLKATELARGRMALSQSEQVSVATGSDDLWLGVIGLAKLQIAGFL